MLDIQNLRSGRALASTGNQQSQKNREPQDLEHRLGGLDARNQGDEDLVPKVLADEEYEREEDQKGDEGDESSAHRRDAYARLALKGLGARKGRMDSVCYKSAKHGSIGRRDFIRTADAALLRILFTRNYK